MAEDEFDKAFDGFGEDPAPVTPPADDPVTPPEPPVEEPKKDEEPPVEPPKEEEVVPPADDEKKEEEDSKPPEAPAEEAPQEEPKPLTEEGVRSILSEIRTEERNSGQALENQTQEVLGAYYPEGLSNVLVDKTTGKELRTPQDVVDVSGGEMTTEEAAQWLMNEQYKLDQDVARIKGDAQKIAETTLKFKQDSVTVLQKYEPLFKAYPQLQGKVFDRLMKLVKADKDKGVILSSPDVMEYYDDFLEPYQQAFEFGQKQSATAPTEPPTPPPAKPSVDDRLDESGDGGPAPVNDPNDFAQQVTKELAKGV